MAFPLNSFQDRLTSDFLFANTTVLCKAYIFRSYSQLYDLMKHCRSFHKQLSSDFFHDWEGQHWVFDICPRTHSHLFRTHCCTHLKNRNSWQLATAFYTKGIILNMSTSLYLSQHFLGAKLHLSVTCGQGP